jgi:hypothetical protein
MNAKARAANYRLKSQVDWQIAEDQRQRTATIVAAPALWLAAELPWAQ